jgi:hypothetical protein
MIVTGGPYAPLATPQSCGSAQTVGQFEPWSGNIVDSFSSFTVTGCTNATTGFGFSAGSVLPNAGASSPLVVKLTRQDREQDFSGLSVSLPGGLAANIANVPLCQEPAAGSGTCPESSLIGTATVAVGAGPQPYWLTGKVYLTGPYAGAPFGLSVVVPAKAGPINLGVEVIRATINVDPTTAAVTVKTSPIPQIKGGVPFRLKTIETSVDRPGFVVNPTNCEAKVITANVGTTQGATVPLSTPFAVGSCKSLAFKPSFHVSTTAKTSKRNGAGLDVKLTFPAGAQANLKALKVDLPIALPSRLHTLQHACTQATFAANPATCPPESVVGMAKAITPLLPVPLTGPAYLVSHGGAEEPDLVEVLQGDGVTIIISSATTIKKGITSSILRAVPDAPVSSFDLYLPEGEHSLLAAFGNLCKKKLVMPTKLTGQNGAVVSQQTAIKVTGCPKPPHKATKKTAGRTKTH